MKQKYRLWQRRGGVYYAFDRETKKQISLGTKDKTEATRLLHAKNEAEANPLLQRQMARAYLVAADPAITKRTWRYAFEELAKTKRAENRLRWERAIKDEALNSILDLQIVETRAEHFLTVLAAGTVSTNVFLRRVHNFALDMEWLLKAVIPKRQWPKVHYKAKRAITRDEHEKIVAREQNPERRAFYKLLWELGGSQGDIAKLGAKDIDWKNKGIGYFRAKTGQVAKVRFDEAVEEILRDLPSEGPLFPYLRTVRACDRATEFKQRCKGLGIEGVTLHSYRYSWEERAREAGYPERLAQEALGHGSKAVHRAYAKGVNPEQLTIGAWQKRQEKNNVIPVEFKKHAEEVPGKHEQTANA